MELSTFAVSFPVDKETYGELAVLLSECEASDGMSYRQVLNEWAWTSPDVKGFLVLTYDNEQLAGVVSAVDMLGVHFYEWSGLVAPAYRRKGVGAELYSFLRMNLEKRRADGDLALTISNSTGGTDFVRKIGYVYDFSEVTMEAEPEEAREEMDIRELTDETAEVKKILMDAFQDTVDEVEALMEFNLNDPGRNVWVVYQAGAVVGTVTIVDGEDSLWVTALAVDPLQTGKGIGTSILKFSRDEAMRKGKQKVLLDVEITNENALSVYKNAGFRKTLQVDYYKKVDVLVN